MRNSITDVAGVTVGHAGALPFASGVTVALFEEPATASGCVLGGAPGGRDMGLLEPDALVGAVDALVLSGGSTFGLDAGGGVQAWLKAKGRGGRFAGRPIPLAPTAILFDLAQPGVDWRPTRDTPSPYAALGWDACEAASVDVALGSVGAGLGATTVNLKGGIGSASACTGDGATVGALVAVNAIGSAVMGQGPHFHAAPFEQGTEFGGLGMGAVGSDVDWKGRRMSAPPTGTTIAMVATDAALSKAELKRLAIAASAGLARALRLAFAPTDGDTVFAASTARRAAPGDLSSWTELCAVAADVLARAIARGVYEATALPEPGALPAWRDLYASRA